MYVVPTPVLRAKLEVLWGRTTIFCLKGFIITFTGIGLRPLTLYSRHFGNLCAILCSLPLFYTYVPFRIQIVGPAQTHRALRIYLYSIDSLAY